MRQARMSNDSLENWSLDKCKKLSVHLYKLNSGQMTCWPHSIPYQKADDDWLVTFAKQLEADNMFQRFLCSKW